MYSKAEAKKLREEFWTSFGKSFPRKWVLYDTKIKDFSFKFYFDTKKAIVSLDIEDNVLINRILYYEKLVSLKGILLEEYLPDAIFEDCYVLDNDKEISRIYVQKENVNIHNKNTWRETMEFLFEKMLKFEEFWYEYEDVIKENF
ncbi:DUF4268 domain-containing protein [Capnocytophaga cynodegmi]|uniref:DUF4268 domain-containing protein n=1 Tax=Capnocytophaga cynodegmi TaxID=28189 RepID=A0A0B7H219_9FLAO|nr:DUF4268 domain-containing protein [Capnocytophaga cynodegmi]GIM52749.1 hypothetical protein CAPN004_17790 [Capnocytophaga cynodegmi]CEN33616.1 conserved hypothetical protein [Capnocytophaga cynodegmi]CEN41943.1 conserved hypothetical protein [Capnocytophaga cynodegmi]